MPGRNCFSSCRVQMLLAKAFAGVRMGGRDGAGVGAGLCRFRRVPGGFDPIAG